MKGMKKLFLFLVVAILLMFFGDQFSAVIDDVLEDPNASEQSFPSTISSYSEDIDDVKKFLDE